MYIKLDITEILNQKLLLNTYFIKSKDSVNLECHILYVTASNFLCLIQIYGPDYWPKKL